MDVSRNTDGGGRSTGVVVGSVWESRMKLDEVKGGIKVFNGEEICEEEERTGKTIIKKSPFGNGKRKTWKSESIESSDKNPIQIARGKSEPQKNSDGRCKGLSVSADGIRKNPIQVRKLKSEGSKDISASVDKSERSPIQTRKQRSETMRRTTELGKEVGVLGEGPERSPVLRKVKSESIKSPDHTVKSSNGSVSGSENQLRKAKSEPNQVIDEPIKAIEESVCGNEKKTGETGTNGSDDNCKEFGVSEDKVLPSSDQDIMGGGKSSSKVSYNVEDDEDSAGNEEALEGDEEELDEDDEIEVEKKSFVVKEINEETSKKVVNEVEKFHQINQNPICTPLTVKQPPPIERRSRIYQNFSKPNPIPKAEEYYSFPQTQDKLQSLVDLIMWRDISKSALVFGFGTFVIMSSSYVKDVNVSFVSVFFYVNLVYLAAIFLYRSLICGGVMEGDDRSYVLGEEEAIWVVKLFLPYINEFLLKLRALFSGDPSTTMKMAMLLFLLARCGSFITIWTMAKLGFFGVFTVPKICSKYSLQLTGYATFWVRRFRDAWDSCSHKKAVGGAMFVMVWNMSSIVARVWAAFLAFVVFRYYRQNLVREEEEEKEDAGGEVTLIGQQQTGGQRQGRSRPTLVERSKQISKEKVLKDS